MLLNKNNCYLYNMTNQEKLARNIYFFCNDLPIQKIEKKQLNFTE